MFVKRYNDILKHVQHGDIVYVTENGKVTLEITAPQVVASAVAATQEDSSLQDQKKEKRNEYFQRLGAAMKQPGFVREVFDAHYGHLLPEE